ncbi:hypothetical protein HDF18_21605 [Mucilaginibacter sp. X5P1]|uniref:hypothetical protein n=1 Tax=Mucilaginibacter sp. X5P1 TaxID=2723088 RepID=UPI001608FAF0|nr:hypothetical protein [Mucilaginibacter sp. X5P1]MBB6140211.1 hypothetical protein [Mucilaginibacter sp. X5P1]
MNQLEAHQVIEDAVKYTGKSVFLYKVNPTTFKREKYHCRYDGEFLIMEYAINQEKVNVKVIAKMILLENESDYLPYELFFVLEEFRKQGVNPKD